MDYNKVMNSALGVGALVCLYLGLNSFLNLFNRWALGIYGFKFPLIVTCCHLFFGFVALAPYQLLGKNKDIHENALRETWPGIVLVGLFMAVNIALNNASLVGMVLSLNQVIRASIPCFTALFAIGIEGRTPSRMQTAGLVPISLGVMVAVWEGSHTSSSTSGIILCCIATVSNALMMTISGRVMTSKIDSIRLTFYTAPVSVMALLPFALYQESSAFEEYYSVNATSTMLLLLGGSIAALAYNVIHNQMIAVMSATATTVLGNVKIVILIFASAVMFGETNDWGYKLVGGTALTLGGFFLYSYAGLRDKLEQMRASELKAEGKQDGSYRV